MELYEKVKELADKKGLTIASVEKAAGLANGTIGKWREAKRGIRMESVKSVAAALGVSIEELL